MKAHLKILISLSTLVFIGIGVVHSAYADEYTAKENEEQYRVFQRDYEAGARPLLFALPSEAGATAARSPSISQRREPRADVAAHRARSAS